MTPPRCLQVALSSSPQPTWLRRLQAPEEALPPARRRRSPELGARPRRRGGPASPPGPRARRAGGAAAAPPRFGTATSSPDPRPLHAVNSDVQFRRWPSLGDSRLPPMLRGVQVRSLVGELGSCKLHGVVKENNTKQSALGQVEV
ncbi:serine/arginine repetitive matrix protein 1-like isoform X2 [Orcinus orca]|uniref:serine/arginine repetitive matrix protein 1-like isoform X2 n=1 Tax=Orcinus orca TaxID=9733 RepID=UPI002111FAB4|nr:serine/arginine repetitive matrix protein 1-like isoform X2 [Orcinus orca]